VNQSTESSLGALLDSGIGLAKKTDFVEKIFVGLTDKIERIKIPNTFP
jgi:hypothetical protein